MTASQWMDRQRPHSCWLQSESGNRPTNAREQQSLCSALQYNYCDVHRAIWDYRTELHLMPRGSTPYFKYLISSFTVKQMRRGKSWRVDGDEGACCAQARAHTHLRPHVNKCIRDLSVSLTGDFPADRSISGFLFQSNLSGFWSLQSCS